MYQKIKKVTYLTFTCDYRPLKDEKWRICIVVGGDKLPYDADSGSPTTNLIKTKLLLNSTISDAKKGAGFASMDLKDMFLHTPMEHPEYMQAHYRYFPTDIRKRYNLDSFLHSDGYVYIKIKRGMYGLKQAAILAYDHLSTLLKAGGYSPIIGSLGMWKHHTRPTIFCLCVDDFGVKYYSKDDLLHLKTTVEKCYTCKVDWQGCNFLGYTIHWDYDKVFVDISMPGYLSSALTKLQYVPKVHPQYTPHEFNAVKYSKKGDTQYAQKPDTSNLLSPTQTKYVQTVVGTLLYYAHALDSTMLPALNDIGSQQAQPT